MSIAGHDTALQLTDMPVGVLFILACSSLGVFGIVLAGWSRLDLPAARRAALGRAGHHLRGRDGPVVRRGVPLRRLAVAPARSSPRRTSRWFVLTLPVSFVIYVIAMVGETNRAPFDLPEAESELVGGFHTEYTSLKFAMFFLAEYINMITVSALADDDVPRRLAPPFPFCRVELDLRGLLPAGLVPAQGR